MLLVALAGLGGARAAVADDGPATPAAEVDLRALVVAGRSRMTRYSRALFGAVVVVAAGAVVAGLQPDPPMVDEPSSWTVPVGYSILSTVDTDGGAIRLWEHHGGTAMCFVQEEVDQDGRHESAVSASCWEATDPAWRTARGMATLVIAPPRQAADALLVTAPGSSPVGPFPVHAGLVMIPDHWEHEPVRLTFQALDKFGKPLGPAESKQLEAT